MAGRPRGFFRRRSERASALPQTDRGKPGRPEGWAPDKSFRGLLESVPDAMVILTEEEVIASVNGRAERMFGYAGDRLIGQPIEVLVPELSRGPGGTDLYARREDGSAFPVEISLTPIEAEGGRLLVSVLRDITESKRVESELAKLAEGTRELEDFAIAISHDLREPLRKIRTFSERLQRSHSGELTESGRDYLERMDTTAQRMQLLLDSLLVLSRTSTNAQRFEPTDLTRVTRDVLSSLDLEIAEAGGRIEVGDLPTIEADSLQAEQLLTNLVDNALKFHRASEVPEIKIYGRIVEARSGATDDELCEIVVEDRGIGFDERHCDRIFLPFERLVDRDAFEGTGIGLAMCRKIAHYHGGTITAKSTPGMGSKFIVTLPMRQKPNEAE